MSGNNTEVFKVLDSNEFIIEVYTHDFGLYVVTNKRVVKIA